MQKKCKYKNKKTGEKCNAFALESGYCFSHDPDKKEEKKKAVVKGGKAPKRVNLNLPPVKIRKPEDVVEVLEETVNLVRDGTIKVSNPANTIGFLCSHILKAIELASVGPKLEAIDRIILERKRKG